MASRTIDPLPQTFRLKGFLGSSINNFIDRLTEWKQLRTSDLHNNKHPCGCAVRGLLAARLFYPRIRGENGVFLSCGSFLLHRTFSCNIPTCVCKHRVFSHGSAIYMNAFIHQRPPAKRLTGALPRPRTGLITCFGRLVIFSLPRRQFS